MLLNSLQNHNLKRFLLILSCKFPANCVPYGSYVKINPNNQLMITGTCLNGTCDNVNAITYQYYVWQLWQLSSSDIQQKWLPYSSANTSDLANSDTLDLVIRKSLFDNNNSTQQWKVQLLTTTLSQSGYATGLSSIIIQLNQLPTNGSCSANPLSGYASSTNFVINCTGWTDPDGYIVQYSYFGWLNSF